MERPSAPKTTDDLAQPYMIVLRHLAPDYSLLQANAHEDLCDLANFAAEILMEQFGIEDADSFTAAQDAAVTIFAEEQWEKRTRPERTR